MKHLLCATHSGLIAMYTTCSSSFPSVLVNRVYITINLVYIAKFVCAARPHRDSLTQLHHPQSLSVILRTTLPADA
jgi:hypothetical protein